VKLAKNGSLLTTDLHGFLRIKWIKSIIILYLLAKMTKNAQKEQKMTKKVLSLAAPPAAA